MKVLYNICNMCTLDLTDHDMYAPTFETMVLVPMHMYQHNMIKKIMQKHLIMHVCTGYMRVHGSHNMNVDVCIIPNKTPLV